MKGVFELNPEEMSGGLPLFIQEMLGRQVENLALTGHILLYG